MNISLGSSSGRSCHSQSFGLGALKDVPGRDSDGLGGREVVGVGMCWLTPCETSTYRMGGEAGRRGGGQVRVGVLLVQHAEDDVRQVAQLQLVELGPCLVAKDGLHAALLGVVVVPHRKHLGAPAQHVEERVDVRLGGEVQPGADVPVARPHVGHSGRVQPVHPLLHVALSVHPCQHVL
eukprot:scaffold7901_cov104-Isochrysis_galbana.AAC.1